MSADIGNLQVGRPPQAAAMPAAPPAPTPIAPQAPQTAAQIVAPPPSGSSSSTGRKVLIGAIVLLVIGVLAAVAFSFLGGSGEPAPTPSVAASASPTPTPSATLISRSGANSFFSGQSSTVTLGAEGAEQTDFINAVSVAQPPAGQVVKLDVRDIDSPMTGKEFFSLMYGTSAPAAVSGNIGDDWSSLVFGQTETADASGSMIITDTVSNRLILIFEVTDPAAVKEAMPAWEADSLATSSAPLFGYAMANQIVPSFSDGGYLEVPVRYWNFPYADRALDWAITEAPNGKTYLLLGGSKQSMFYAMDRMVK